MAEGNRRLIVVRQAFLELEIRYVDLDISKSTRRICIMDAMTHVHKSTAFMEHVL